MKQVNSFRYWLATLLMFCIGMTAQAQKTLTVGTSEHGTVTFSTEDANPATTAAEGKTVTVNIAPAGKGWKVDKVTATAYTSWNVAGARGEMPTEIPAIKVIAVDQATYTFTMPAYDVQVDVTYKTTSLKDATIGDIADETYTGFQITPTPAVKDGETGLEAGTDFTYEYGENINVATGGTVTIKPVEGSGFTDSKTVPFNILPKSINATDITVADIAPQPYQGSQIQPAVTVKDKTRGVNLGTNDYTTSFGENINVATGGTVTITGKGNYKDSREVTFQITKVDPTNVVAPSKNTGLVYNEKAQQLIDPENPGSATGGKIEYSIDGGNTWSQTIPTKTDANESGYPVKWRVTGDENHNNTTPQEIKVPIEKATLTTVTLVKDKLEFTNNEQTVQVKEVKAGELTVPTSGYTIQNNTNKGTNVGKYEIKVDGKGNFKGTAKTDWWITKTAPSATKEPTPNTDLIYNEKDQNLVTPGETNDGTIQYSTDGGNTWSPDIPTGKDVGEYPVQWKIVGDDNHSDSDPKTLSPDPKISPATITKVELVNNKLTYNGKEQQVKISKVYAGSLVVPTSDYTIAEGSDKGTHVSKDYAVSVTGKNNFTGTKTAGWEITPLSIANATVTLNPSEYTYDGTAKEPEATVTVGDITLTSADFDIDYENNTDAGTATAIITGKGDFGESTSENFTIKPAELTSVTLKQTSLTYIYKTEQTVEIDVVKAGDLNVAAANYTVSGNKGTDAKGYTVTVTAKPNTNYTGSATADWTILPKSATNFTVELDQREFTYDGNYKFPNVTVKDGSNVLAENTDYTLEFRDNKRAGINTAKVIVTGINNYTDKKEDVTFSILRADGEVKADPEQITMTYGLDPQTATVKIVSPTDLENYYFVSSDENVATVDPETGVVTSQGAGVATIYVVVMADNNYESMYAVCQVIVKPVEIVEADVTEGEANANGLPSYTVKKFGKTLEEGVDYTLEFFDKDEVKQAATYVVANSGDYMAVLTFSGNYYGIVEKKFKANGLPISVANFTNMLLNAENPNEPVNAENAKYNFNGDEFINIADLQALLNLQLGLTAEGDPISSGSRASVNVAEDAVMNISTSDLGGGVTRYTLSLEGGRQFSAFLMDVVTAGSAMVISEQAAEGMQLYSNTLGSTLRVIGLAESTAAEGSVLQIDVMGDGSVSFGNISFSTPGATAFNVRMGDATGISLTSAAAAEGDVFGLGGQRQETLQKGVNIVRGQNGKSVKVLRK